ncbi:hypothetical protein F2P56_027037 [Juglans regia]|uniref:Lactate/malate dehydrogenase N-terminal domain-containing protein n=2 Tax=Juglans regia TaxID=51240 RepID=A0A833X8U9_JUGRE|nr:malate dehydrogenase, cytoplasmic-like [Juglans regia]KAF5451990.1 hypothetical protein F2P56_027037 [Juglans regia]
MRVDATFPLLKDVVAMTDIVVETCTGVNMEVMGGGFPKKDDMERKDVMSKNISIYKSRVSALEKHATASCKVLVFANPQDVLSAPISSAAYSCNSQLVLATLTATMVHVLLFSGCDLWEQSKSVFGGSKKEDIHTKLMKKYKSAPTWWFIVILALNIVL